MKSLNSTQKRSRSLVELSIEVLEVFGLDFIDGVVHNEFFEFVSDFFWLKGEAILFFLLPLAKMKILIIFEMRCFYFQILLMKTE